MTILTDSQARALGAELKALASAATPGPWTDGGSLCVWSDTIDGYVALSIPRQGDAALISKVHDAIALADYWEARAAELQARLGALHEVVKDADKLDADVITILEFLR